MADDFLVRFRGVRGSYPVPGPSTARVGGNTACVEVRAGGHLIVIDAGTGIIGLGRDLMRERAQRPAQAGHENLVVTIFFTHTHHDHTQGFPFFTPAYLPSTVVHMYGPKTFHEDLEEVLERAMIAPVFPVTLEDMAALKRIENVAERNVVILAPDSRKPEVRDRHRHRPDAQPDAVVVTPMKSYAHPKGGVVVYKVEYGGRKLVHATDVEGYVGGDVHLSKFAEGADLLIHDAQFLHEEYADPRAPKQGWGHSTPEMAAEVARAAGVKRLALFHHDPDHDDDTVERIERYSRDLFPGAFAATEGMEIRL